MTSLFSTTAGYWMLAGYGVAVMALTLIWGRLRNNSKVEFLAASRNLKEWESAASIAATWIWAPALFVAAQKAYQQGWPGVFWFTVPNVLCLIIFAPFAAIIRKRVPNGYTVSDYIRTTYSKRAQSAYLFQLLGLATCSFAVQLLAGGKVVAWMTGVPFWQVTIILSVIAISYSWISGLRASVLTDYWQMAWIAAVGILAVPWVMTKTGAAPYVAGLAGLKGTFTSLVSGDGAKVFWTFGLSTTIGLLSGPFGDQSFWQRAFAVQEDKVKGAFIKGAFIFAIVPITMSALGFIGAGLGMTVKDPSLINVEVVSRFLPKLMLVPFLYMLLSGLCSTLDSNLCAVSSLIGHDILNRRKTPATENAIVGMSRLSMLGLGLLAMVIANIPGMTTLYLFMFYGTLRASTLLPTVMTLLAKKADRYSEAGVFWGVVLAIAIGLPIFAYGNYKAITPMIVGGSLFTVTCSGFVTWLLSRRKATA